MLLSGVALLVNMELEGGAAWGGFDGVPLGFPLAPVSAWVSGACFLAKGTNF